MKTPLRVRLGRLAARMGATLLDHAETLDGWGHQRCLAYGGIVSSGKIRLCPKRRWHYDSHTYELFDPFKFESIEEFIEAHPA